MSKISPHYIFVDHALTLRKTDSKSINRAEVIRHFGLPLLAACAVSLPFCPTSDGDIRLILINIFAIFAPLLMNLMMVFHSLCDRFQPRAGDTPGTMVQKQDLLTLVGETQANVSFGTWISILLLVVVVLDSVLIFILSTWVCSICPLCDSLLLFVPRILDFVIWYVVVLFILVMLMVLKRSHVLFKNNQEFAKC